METDKEHKLLHHTHQDIHLVGHLVSHLVVHEAPLAVVRTQAWGRGSVHHDIRHWLETVLLCVCVCVCACVCV